MPMTNKAFLTTMESPVGSIGIGYNPEAVLCLSLGRFASTNAVKMDTAATLGRLGYTIDRGSHPTGKILKRELREYFQGIRTQFSVHPHFLGTPFQIEVWKLLYSVPYGKILTYGELAALAGRPKAARAVGAAMGQNHIPIIVPCHRIIAANGSLGGFGYGLEVKKRLLQLEGRREFD